jgi:hypothetical protein
MGGRMRLDMLVFFLVLPGLFWLLDEMSWFRQLQMALQIQAVPTGVLNYGEMGSILKELGYIRLAGNDESRYPRTDTATYEQQQRIDVISFQKKRRVDEHVYQANPAGRYGILHQFFPHGLIARGRWPVLAIHVQEKDLHDPETGILLHREQQGKGWEREAEVLIVKDGSAVFYSAVGLRVHGGKRRLSQYLSDYRLYFRRQIGVQSLPAGTFSNQEMPVRTLVVKNVDWPVGQPMNTPLAFDISKRIGCLVPETSLVELYINGRSIGMAYVTEHLSRRQWDQRLGHQDYVFFKFKGDFLESDEKRYHKAFWQVATAKQGFLMDSVAKSIDLDNFSRHVFSWVFNGTTDFCQGVGLIDPQEKNARLRWINWDMDQSFYDKDSIILGIDRKNWAQEGFGLISGKDGSCDRQILFSRLIRESEAYRRYFSELVMENLNHRLTPDFLLGRVDFYRQMLEEFGEPHQQYIAMLEEFMHHRGRFLQEEMAKLFNLEGPYSCRVISPGQQLLIDGYPYKADYNGRYFKGQSIELEPAGASVRRFSHWLVDGKKVTVPRLEHTIEKGVTIEAVFNSR